MKKRWKLVASAALLGTAFWLGNVMAVDSQASSSKAGSVNDPLITKSYLEKRLKELQGSQTSQGTGGKGITEESVSELIVIKLEPGQTLYGGPGAEFIVRTGKAVAVSTDANGIPDVTAGKDIADGQLIANNHLLVFPRDGRGITYAEGSKAPIYVMIRGSFLLLNKDGSEAEPTID